MGRYGIKQALVASTAALEYNARAGNQVLAREIEAHASLFPLYALTPDSGALEEAAALTKDLQIALERSWRRDLQPPFLPAIAGVKEPFHLAVARDRLIAPQLANRLVGIPLYYAAQVLLALSVGGAGAAAATSA